MYGVQTTGKPIKILSKISKRKPTHYYEIQIDTKKNIPELLNAMDVFALTSDNEANPVSIIEAMATGLPVLPFCEPPR